MDPKVVLQGLFEAAYKELFLEVRNKEALTRFCSACLRHDQNGWSNRMWHVFGQSKHFKGAGQIITEEGKIVGTQSEIKEILHSFVRASEDGSSQGLFSHGPLADKPFKISTYDGKLSNGFQMTGGPSTDGLKKYCHMAADGKLPGGVGGGIGGKIGAGLGEKLYEGLCRSFQHDVSYPEQIGISIGRSAAPVAGSVAGAYVGAYVAGFQSVSTMGAIKFNLVTAAAGAASGVVVGAAVVGCAAVVGLAVHRAEESQRAVRRARKEVSEALAACKASDERVEHFQAQLREYDLLLDRIESSLTTARSVLEKEASRDQISDYGLQAIVEIDVCDAMLEQVCHSILEIKADALKTAGQHMSDYFKVGSEIRAAMKRAEEALEKAREWRDVWLVGDFVAKWHEMKAANFALQAAVLTPKKAALFASAKLAGELQSQAAQQHSRAAMLSLRVRTCAIRGRMKTIEALVDDVEMKLDLALNVLHGETDYDQMTDAGSQAIVDGFICIDTARQIEITANASKRMVDALGSECSRVAKEQSQALASAQGELEFWNGIDSWCMGSIVSFVYERLFQAVVVGFQRLAEARVAAAKDVLTDCVQGEALAAEARDRFNKWLNTCAGFIERFESVTNMFYWNRGTEEPSAMRARRMGLGIGGMVVCGLNRHAVWKPCQPYWNTTRSPIQCSIPHLLGSMTIRLAPFIKFVRKAGQSQPLALTSSCALCVLWHARPWRAVTHESSWNLGVAQFVAKASK